MYARGNFPALSSAARDGIRRSRSCSPIFSAPLSAASSWAGCAAASTSASWAAAMPAPPTRCAPRAPAFAIWVILIDIAKGWIAAARVAGLRAARGSRRRRRPWRRGCRRCAPSRPSSATCFRCGTAFAAARAWPRSWARSPASSSALLLPLFASWLGVVMVSGFVGLASIIAALAIPVYLLMRDGAVLSPVLGFALACAAARHLHASRQRAAHARRHRAARPPAVAVRARSHVSSAPSTGPLPQRVFQRLDDRGIPVGRSARRGPVGHARRRLEGGRAAARARRRARCAAQQGLSARAGRQRAVGGAHPGAVARRCARAHRSAAGRMDARVHQHAVARGAAAGRGQRGRGAGRTPDRRTWPARARLGRAARRRHLSVARLAIPRHARGSVRAVAGRRA